MQTTRKQRLSASALSSLLMLTAELILVLNLPHDTLVSSVVILGIILLPAPYYWVLQEYISKRQLKNHRTLNRQALSSIVSTHDSELYLGRGFLFEPRHTQKLMRSLADGIVTTADGRHGASEIHNVKLLLNYQPLFQSCHDLSTHTLIFGTTGAGKTRMLDLLVSQAVMRGDTVIVLDPKGDASLRNNIEKACELTERKDSFVSFDLASPASGVNLDVLGTYDTATEIASRIASLMSDAGSSASFKSHAINALTSATVALKLKMLLRREEGCSDVRETKLTPAAIRDVVADFDAFRDIVLEFFTGYVAKLKHYRLTDEQREVVDSFKDVRAKTRRQQSVAPLREFYNTLIRVNVIPDRNADLDLLFSTANLDKTFYSKVTAGILPKLNSLAAGDLHNALSSGEGLTFSEVVAGNKVLYASLRTLVDSETGANLGKQMLADLCAVAGKIYANKSISSNNRHVCIFVDEASEILCESMVQLANKSRGAGFALTLVTQTIADFVKHGGSKADAEQIVANANNLISMRVIDQETANVVTSRMPNTYIDERSASRNYTHYYDDKVISKTETEREVPLFPARALELLPDLEYVAKLADGRVIKGIIPFISDEEEASQEASAKTAAQDSPHYYEGVRSPDDTDQSDENHFKAMAASIYSSARGRIKNSVREMVSVTGLVKESYKPANSKPSSRHKAG